MVKIEQALAAPEIVAAGWTSDGHHGSQTLRPWSTPGYSTVSLYWASDADRQHVVRYGTSFDDKRLIIFQGFVPDGEKRVYDIAILADSLDRR
jgi:hypothetical protein